MITGNKRTSESDRQNHLIPDKAIFQKRREKFYGPNPDIPDPTPQSIQLDMISQSRLTGYYETMKTIRALKQKGPISENKLKIEQDIKNYFLRETGIDYGDNAIPKNKINYKSSKTIIETNALIINNIRMMSRKSAVVYMRYFQPKEVIFLSLNQMKIIFDTQQIAEKALYGYKRHCETWKDPSPPRYCTDPFRNRVNLSKQRWYELIPYSVFGIQIPLFGRFATNHDVKIQKELNSGIYQKIKLLKTQLKQKAMNTKQNAQILFQKCDVPPYFQGDIKQNQQDIDFIGDNKRNASKVKREIKYFEGNEGQCEQKTETVQITDLNKKKRKRRESKSKSVDNSRSVSKRNQRSRK